MEHFCVNVEHFWFGDLAPSPLRPLPPPSLCGSQIRCLPPLLRIHWRHSIFSRSSWRRRRQLGGSTAGNQAEVRWRGSFLSAWRRVGGGSMVAAPAERRRPRGNGQQCGGGVGRRGRQQQHCGRGGGSTAAAGSGVAGRQRRRQHGDGSGSAATAVAVRSCCHRAPPQWRRSHRRRQRWRGHRQQPTIN